MGKYLHLALLAAGALLFWAGWGLTYYADVQALEYNRGCDYYRTGDLASAALSFERSFNAYDRSRHGGGLGGWLYPQPQRRFAALARFYRADCFLDLKQFDLALNELIAGLRDNPGELDLDDLALNQVSAVLDEQCDMAIDVELLFKANPEMAKAAGKGSGKGKDKKPGGDQPGAAERDPNDPRRGTQAGMPSSIDDI